MQFYSPGSFRLLWLIPVLILLLIASHRFWLKRLTQWAKLDTVKNKLIPEYRWGEWQIRSLCLLLVFLFSVIALARPQWGEEKKKIQRKGVDLIFVLDTSLSMLAEDSAPNRFMKAKIEIKSFIRHLKGDRVGMVASAGSSFLQSPLTLDYSAFMLFLDAIDVGYIPDPGTSLDRAIRLAVNAFPEKKLKHKAIILFTDGEDHEGGIDQAIEEASKANVRVYTIGVGTAEGAPIPLRSQSGQKAGFKKDRSGQIVITKLNQPLLEKIAKETGGIYLPSTPGEQEVDLILKHLESLGQTKYKERLVAEKEDHFQLFLILAFLFLIFEMFVRRHKKLPVQTLIILLSFFLFNGFLETPKDMVNKGNGLYGEKKYQSAIEKYRQAQIKDPDDPSVQYNLGTALYQVDEFQEAAKSFEKSIDKIQDKSLKSKALYNYGNTQYRLGNFDKSIEAYEKSLDLNPDDEDAKYNLEFVQKQKSMFEKKDQERKKNQEQKSPQQKQKDQKQQQQQQKQQQQEQQQQQQEQQQQQQEQQQQQQEQQQQQQQQEQQKQGEDEQQAPKPEDSQDQSQQKQQNQQDQQKDQGQEDQQKSKPEEQKGDQEQPLGGEQQEQRAPRPLQGQMSVPEALRILDALKEGEKELQDLRKPPIPPQNKQVEKDW